MIVKLSDLRKGDPFFIGEHPTECIALEDASRGFDDSARPGWEVSFKFAGKDDDGRRLLRHLDKDSKTSPKLYRPVAQ